MSAEDAAVLAAVRQGTQHVIFLIKENRTYDQVLGDLEFGNGDPDLTEFGEAVTPNQHNLARTFVTLDNFLDTAEVSYDGWLWTTSARAPDVVERQYPVAYAARGTSLDSEGLNRNVNVAIDGVVLCGDQRALLHVGARIDAIFVLEASYLAQTLDQLRNRTALTLQTPPAGAPLFIPGCSTRNATFDCGLADFVAVSKRVIDRRSADRVN